MAGQGLYRSIRPKPVNPCVTLKARNQFVELLLAHNTGGSMQNFDNNNIVVSLEIS